MKKIESVAELLEVFDRISKKAEQKAKETADLRKRVERDIEELKQEE